MNSVAGKVDKKGENEKIWEGGQSTSDINIEVYRIDYRDDFFFAYS